MSLQPSIKNIINPNSFGKSLTIAAAIMVVYNIIILTISWLMYQSYKATSKIEKSLTKKINDITGTNYEVRIIKNRSMNAFYAGGKYVFLTSSLYKKSSIDECIAVALHEVGHAENKHIQKMIPAGLASSILFFSLLLFKFDPQNNK